jgi:hypothetical protein
VRRLDQTADRLIAGIASRSHGVVTHAELRAAGLTAAEIRHRVQTGALLCIYRGVYRVGHVAPSVEADYMAAVKSAGVGAPLSGLAAAHLWYLIKGEPPAPEIASPRQKRIPGLLTHHCRQLSDVDRTRWR